MTNAIIKAIRVIIPINTVGNFVYESMKAQVKAKDAHIQNYVNEYIKVLY